MLGIVVPTKIHLFFKSRIERMRRHIDLCYVSDRDVLILDSTAIFVEGLQYRALIGVRLRNFGGSGRHQMRGGRESKG